MSEMKGMSVSSLTASYHEKRQAAEVKQRELKGEIDARLMEAEALERRAKKKREAAKAKYQELDKLDYGSWMSDILWPLADELARRTGKKASLCGPVGIGSKVIIILSDQENDPGYYRKEHMRLTVEPDFSDDRFALRYETGAVNDRYAPGTLGQAHGLNNTTAPLPDSVEEILGLFRLCPAITHNDKGGEVQR